MRSGLVVVAFAAVAVAFGGSPATRVYRDARYGFVLTYPKTFRVVPFSQVSHPYPNQTLEGAAFGNVRRPERSAFNPEAKVAPREAVLLVEHSAGGPPPVFPVSGHDTALPLTRAGFRPDPSPESEFAPLVGNGWNLWVSVRIGAHAAKADRGAAWRMVRSLRMRPLRPGETTGEASYLVMDRTDTYPVGSVTKVGAVFLVHAPHGFYAMRGDSSCDLTFTLPVAFSCPDGRRWDRVGRPLWTGASGQDALSFAPTAVAGDGHVLVAENAVTGGNVDDIERQLWG